MPAVRPLVIGLGVVAIIGTSADHASSRTVASPSGGFAPAVKHAKPTVSPLVGVPGGRIVVHGTGCTSQAYTYGVEVAVTTQRGSVVASGFVNHDQIKRGAWSAAFRLPKSLKIGNYSVASTCDQYQYSFGYPTVALAVRRALTLTASAPESVRRGRSATLTAKATSGRSVVRGLRLVVQYRLAGKKAFHTLKSLKTGSKGQATLAVRPTATTIYRVTAPTGSIYESATSHPLVVKVTKNKKK